MTTTWLFPSSARSKPTPKITNQAISIDNALLALRNPWVNDSVFMGKLYTAIIFISALYLYSGAMDDEYRQTLLSSPHAMFQYLIAPLIFTPFLAYRIYFIKNLSSFYLSRLTRKVYYQRGKTLISFNWSITAGGIFKRTEFGGSSFTTSYALAFAPRRQDHSLNQKDSLWIDSNEPTSSDITPVAEVWEYLSRFMEQGPSNLPRPREPDWWRKPLHAICLTPAEAWRHYAPWRTGEPGEMQGKKNWQLPFWAVLFPYNLSVAICWWVICCLFNVRAAPAPAEAFEEAPAKPTKRKRK